jgi:hypothetical protein
MSQADRIARDRLRSQQAAICTEQKSQAHSEATNAQHQLNAIALLSHEVLALLAIREYKDPEPEPVTLTVFRFPPLGDLFGYRQLVKGGWKIAHWKYDREKPGHTIWLFEDGRYGWNSQIVRLPAFADWYRSPYVSQGPPLMQQGLGTLKEQLEFS